MERLGGEMKFVFVADTHGFEPDLPKADVLLHAGDFSPGAGKLEAVGNTIEWLNRQPIEVKIVIAGNHDFAAAKHPELVRNMFIQANIDYLIHESLRVGKYKIFGSPYHPHIWGKFGIERPALRYVWDMIPDDTDILLTHGPPFGVLDYAVRGGHVGDEFLYKRVKEVNPLIHVFGHIHEGYGSSMRFANASLCNENYELVNPPIMWDDKRRRFEHGPKRKSRRSQ